MLVRRSPAAVTRWLRRGLVPVTVAPLGAWTGITLAEERARSAAPYDVGLEVLAARPAPWRTRPTIGLFDVHGRAALTVQPRGPRADIHWLVWEPRTGVVADARADPAAAADAPGGRRRRRAGCARRPSPTCCAPGTARPSTCSSPCSACSGLPGQRPARARRLRGRHRRRAVAARHPRLRPADGRGGRPPRRDRRHDRPGVDGGRAVSAIGRRPRLRQRQHPQRGAGPRARGCRRHAHGRPARPRWPPTGCSCRASATSTPAWPGSPPPTGRSIIDLRLAGGRPVLGVCVGMQVMFEGSTEPSASPVAGVGEWPGTVDAAARAGRAAHGLVDGRRARADGAVRRRRAGAVLLRALLRRAPLGAARRPTVRSRWSSRGSPGPPTASGSSPRSRTARCRRPSSTPRSPARPGLALLANWVRSL